MNKFKRIFTLIVIVLLILSICACGVKIYQTISPDEPAITYSVESVELDTNNIVF